MLDRKTRPAEASDAVALDYYLSRDVRSILEERFLRAIEEVATLEALSRDASALAEHELHPALFADHGIVHARDVAAGIVSLAATANATLLPARPNDRQEFVVGLAVLLAYIHDAGMKDPSPSGRRLHALYAAQLPLSGAMDDVLLRLWEDRGPVVLRIGAVSATAPFRVSEDVVLRELAALSLGHSKSLVDSALFRDVAGLRRALLNAVLVDLEDHRRRGDDLSLDGELPRRLGPNARRYSAPAHDGFAWLDSADQAHRALAEDAVDAIRLLRAADALRQRGTTLRTAAGYEIFIDADTGHSVFSLRTSTGSGLVYLRVDNAYSSGEANVRQAAVTPHGDLRISFHRGRFTSPEAAMIASAATASVVGDIAADVVGAFEGRRPSDLPAPRREPGSMRIELERPADEPAFAATVAETAAQGDPTLRGRIFVVADLESAAPAERARYLRGVPISAGSKGARQILDALGRHGMRVAAIDRQRAFEDVRRVLVSAGEVLMESGSPPAFVYVGVNHGLRIEQLGGYQAIALSPWVPIGVTGVVRRAERNSRVVSNGTGEVLMIPGELFAREWFRPYEQGEFGGVLAEFSD